MKAIAYIRFSSEEQASGNSVERQKENITAYAQAHRLEITETLIDEGFSASKGEHLTHGKLGRFLAEADKGTFKGVALVIERLDRLSRLGIDETNQLLRRLLAAGVVVHVTEESRVIKDLDDMLTAMMNVVRSFADQEFSKKLSERVGRAWAKKKIAVASGELYTSQLPHWLWVKDGKIVEIPERVATVRKMFELAARGVGSTQICGRLDVPSRAWVTRTLRSRSVLGEFQPDGGELNPTYFPQVVTQSQFVAVRQQINAKRKNFNRKRKREASEAPNLFSGLLYDTTSDPARPLHFSEMIKKNGKRYRYLTSTFKAGLPQHAIRYDALEHWVLQGLQKADWQVIVRQTEPEELVAAMAEFETVLRELDVVKNRISRNTAAIDDETEVAAIKVLARIVAKDEDLIITLTEKQNALCANVDALKAKFSALYNVDVLLDLIADMEKSDRLRLRAEIAKILKRINVKFTKHVIYISVEFINGALSEEIKIPRSDLFRRDSSESAEAPKTSQG